MIEIIVSTTKDGNMAAKFSSDGKENRLRFFKEKNIDNKKAILLNTTNKNQIIDLNDDKSLEVNENNVIYAVADAIVTKEDYFIYDLFGDCIPLVVYDKKNEIVSLAHLGWISVVNDLHIKLVNYFINKYNSNIDDLDIYLGPSIKKESHFIDKKENIKQLNEPNWKDYIEINKDNYLIDLSGYVIHSLNKLGISNINVDDTDTYKSDLYFSHHRSIKEGCKNGRFVYGVRIERG